MKCEVGSNRMNILDLYSMLTYPSFFFFFFFLFLFLFFYTISQLVGIRSGGFCLSGWTCTSFYDMFHCLSVWCIFIYCLATYTKSLLVIVCNLFWCHTASYNLKWIVNDSLGEIIVDFSLLTSGIFTSTVVTTFDLKCNVGM